MGKIIFITLFVVMCIFCVTLTTVVAVQDELIELQDNNVVSALELIEEQSRIIKMQQFIIDGYWELEK